MGCGADPVSKCLLGDAYVESGGTGRWGWCDVGLQSLLCQEGAELLARMTDLEPKATLSHTAEPLAFRGCRGQGRFMGRLHPQREFFGQC